MPPQPPSPRSVFGRAVEIESADERKAYLDGACADAPQLRERVEALLRAHEAAGGFLQTSGSDPDETAPYAPPPAPPSTIGPYKLLEKIGEGGMGEVWVADQLEPIQRRVALKLIKPGMDSRGVLARFEAERQALALMDHPNIARVLDAGTTPDGRPYFVMELVKGTPITEFCDVRKLSPKERLELFVPVCQAIQHAHQKGIIHRDIKPSNVLVELYDDRAVPKVIDFGVAKAVGQRLTEKTLYTGFGALVGTPAYMAPEQATFNALDVDTRADVYALGVILYELLAGSPPIEKERLSKAALDEVLRIVRDEEPVRPSQRLSTSQAKATIAATRQTDPAKLSKLMRGELDWIVMKALEKDRTRRYETANGLAKDVQRHLSGEAVEACPPTLGYRVRKAYRRNRAAVLTAGAFAGLIVGAAVMGFVLAARASDAERVAAKDRDAALHAGREATDQRDEATAARERLRHSLYASDFQMAASLWQVGDRERTLSVLDRHRPGPAEPDLRGFEWHFLNRRCRDAARTLTMSEGWKCISHDGSRVYVVTRSGPRTDGKAGSAVRVWDVTTGQELTGLDPPLGEDVINLRTFTPPGKRGVVMSYLRSPTGAPSVETQNRVIDLETGKVVFTLPRTPPGMQSTAVLDGEGRRLVERRWASPSSVSSEVTVWDVDAGKSLRTISLDTGRGEVFFTLWGALDLSGKRYAAVVRTPDPRTELRAWDVDTGAEVWRVPVDTKSETHVVAYSPDGKHLAEVAEYSGEIRLRNSADSAIRHRLSIPGAEGRSVQKLIQFSLDGSRLALSTRDRPGVYVWDVPGEPTADARPPLQMIATDSPGSRVAFSADGRSLVVAHWSSQVVTTHDLTRRTVRFPGPPALKPPMAVNGVSQTSGRTWAIFQADTADRPGFVIRVWDQNGKAVFTTRTDALTGTPNDYFHSVLTPDGERFIHTQYTVHPTDATKDRAEIRVWDVGTGQEVSRCDLSGGGQLGIIALRPDGRQMALRRTQPNRTSDPSKGPRTRLSLWNVAENKEEYGEESDGSIFNGMYSPDGSRMAVVSGTATQSKPEIRVWDSQTGRTVWARDLNPSTKEVEWPRYTPDGRVLIVPRNGSNSKDEILVLDAATGRDIRPPLMNQAGLLRDLYVSPDGRRLFATASKQSFVPFEPETVVVWDLVSGRELLTLPATNPKRLSIDRDGHRMHLLRTVPGSPDLELETLDGTPLPEAKK